MEDMLLPPPPRLYLRSRTCVSTPIHHSYTTGCLANSPVGREITGSGPGIDGGLLHLRFTAIPLRDPRQDPDTGVWNYAYDALGELVCQQSPNQFAAAGNQATCSSGSYVPAGQTTMAYDVLGRLTSRSEPEYVSSWTYDKNADGSACMPGSTAQGLNGKGKLCQSGASNGVSRQYVYDGYGRPSSARTTVTNGPSFGSAVSYDPATGRLLTQTYPTGVQVGYAYTARGFLEKLLLNTAATITPLPNASGQTASGGTFGPGKILWQTLAVNARGQLETQQYGDSALAQTVFEAATGRVTDLTTTSSTGGRQGDVLSQHYTWDSLNNLTGRNAHHIAETIFKAFGRALRFAVSQDERMQGIIPSTKGSL